MLIRSAPGSAPALPLLRERLRWIVVVVAVLMFLLVGRLWQLQIMRGERYHQGVLSNVLAERLLPSVRGRIVDRDGDVLVDNRPAFNVYAVPSRFDDSARLRLVRALELDDDEVANLDRRLNRARKRTPNRSSLVLEDQGRDRAAIIRQSLADLPVEVRDEPYRRYVKGTLAAHVLGYMNHLSGRELVEHEPLGYEADEFIGRYGLERRYEQLLRGKKGLERYVVDATGKRVEEEGQELIQGDAFVPPVPGHNLVLTLDAQLQQIAEEAVRWHPAAAVAVVEVDTGRLLALVSKPSFDPNTMTGNLTQAEYSALISDPRKPFIDKTLRQHYPPGSTFKFVTMVAAEEDGVGFEEPFECKGSIERGRRRFRCPGHAHGHLDMIGALKKSCNVYVWQLAEKIGLDRMAEVGRAFGFGSPTGLGLNGDVPGRMPTKAWYEQEAQRSFKIGYTLNAATGQGDVEVTVVQLAMAYAAIANGGDLFVPQLVRRIESATGEVVKEFEPTLRRRVEMSAETLGKLHDGMRAVVAHEGGTAHDAESDIVPFSGKTGTAQVRGRRYKKEEIEGEGWHPGRDHAWFAGFAPADDPDIAIVVLIEHGGRGGAVAGPVARDIIEGYFRDVQKDPVVLERQVRLQRESAEREKTERARKAWRAKQRWRARQDAGGAP